MLHEMLIAGFGGQGIVTLGKLIAYAGMLEGHEVCFWPRYGAEMRGGTANCTVILSSEVIDSPLVDVFDTVVAMNDPSLVRFQDRVKHGGQLFWNSTLIQKEPQKVDVEKTAIDTGSVAAELGNIKVANMVVFGAILQKTNLFSLDSASSAMKKLLKDLKPVILQLNELAILKGAEIVRSMQAAEN
jgi:2-oxoglutarate ferredoxin oxidoreductase subunit gamma